MSIHNELEVLRDVCARLESAEIGYMLTGSLAMNYYAQPRMTRDIDLVVQLTAADAEKISQLFEPDYYVDVASVAQAVANASLFNLLHLDSVVKVDMIVRKDTPYRLAEFDRRHRISLGEFDIWIVSKEDLILSKLLWAKPSGSEMQLGDVRNLLQSETDIAYLRHWADELSVTTLLETSLESRHRT